MENGDYVLCAISGKEIRLQELNYWNVELQEAYYSAEEASQRFKSLKNDKFTSIDCASKSIGWDYL